MAVMTPTLIDAMLEGDGEESLAFLHFVKFRTGIDCFCSNLLSR